MRYSLQKLHQPVEDYGKTHSPFPSFPFITLLPFLLYSLPAYPRASFHRTNNTPVFPEHYQQRTSSSVMDYAITPGWDTLFKTGVIKQAMCRSYLLITVNSVYRKAIAHTTRLRCAGKVESEYALSWIKIQGLRSRKFFCLFWTFFKQEKMFVSALK